MSLHNLLLMSSGWIQAIQLLAGLSFLIVLHEFGHFFFARLFKTRVEKFYLFFDFLFPFSTLLPFSLFKKKIGDTEWGIGWFPLGGYVKIAGMVDESMDKEQMAKPPEPWEYRSKKAYQRLLIMLGGIIMNVLVAIGLYMIIFSVWGEEYLPVDNMKYGISVDSTGRSIGLQDGDMVRAIDGKKIERFNEIPLAILLHDDNGTITVGRNGKDTTIKIPDGTISKFIKAKRGNIVGVRVHTVIDTVVPGSLAALAGLKSDDSIVSLDNTPVVYENDFINYRNSHYGQPMVVAYTRGGTLQTATITVPKDSVLGIRWNSMETVKIKYGPLGALARGFTYTIDKMKFYVVQFKLFKSKEVKVNESMGGFYSMGKMYSPEFSWLGFLTLTAFISVALAIMNLLPIPGLDGGYVIFLLWEIITGKQVSEKVMERATTVGLVILLTLMVYVNGLDILRIFTGK